MPTGYLGRPASTCHPDLPTHAKGLCNTCYRRHNRSFQPKNPRRERPAATCHPDRPHRAYGFCHSCYQRDWKVGARARIPGKRAAYNRKMQGKPYKLTPGQLLTMTLEQDGRCAACDQPCDKLQVDHCHKTGVVRGLLCGACNRAAGAVGDNPGRLRSVAAYLESAAADEPLSFPLADPSPG